MRDRGGRREGHTLNGGRMRGTRGRRLLCLGGGWGAWSGSTASWRAARPPIAPASR